MDESEYLALRDGRAFSVIKHRAKPGFRHVVQLPEVYRFVELIPDWATMSGGLSALCLDTHGSADQTGTNYSRGYRAIWMPPFPASMETRWSRRFYDQHADLVSRLRPLRVYDDGSELTLTWTVAQAKAWQLLHLFLYDLSAHAQFMASGQKPRSEHHNETAEAYAFVTAKRVLPAYERAIGVIE